LKRLKPGIRNSQGAVRIRTRPIRTGSG
jgi:hypothetical protein